MWKADFWYIDQLSAMLHGSRVKIISIYVMMKLLRVPNYGHSDLKPNFWQLLESYICHIKHTSVLIFFLVVAYQLLHYKSTKIEDKIRFRKKVISL